MPYSAINEYLEIWLMGHVWCVLLEFMQSLQGRVNAD
jgi:hypothetical protein